MSAAPTDVRPLTCTARPRCLRRGESDSDEAKTEWARSRYAVLRSLGLDERVAVALLSHYARETGWGKSEHNFALGNIRWTAAVGGPAFYQQGSDDSVPRPYRAFSSLEEGARETVALASRGRYLPAWQALLSGAPETEWYSRVMIAGWHPYSDASLEDYAGVLRGMRRRLGLAPSPQPDPLPYRSRLGPALPAPPEEQAQAQPSSAVPIAIVAGAIGIAGLVIYFRPRMR